MQIAFDFDFTLSTSASLQSIKCESLLEDDAEIEGALEYETVNTNGVVTIIAIYERDVRGEKKYLTSILRRRGSTVSFEEEHVWQTLSEARIDKRDWKRLAKQTDW